MGARSIHRAVVKFDKISGCTESNNFRLNLLKTTVQSLEASQAIVYSGAPVHPRCDKGNFTSCSRDSLKFNPDSLTGLNLRLSLEHEVKLYTRDPCRMLA